MIRLHAKNCDDMRTHEQLDLKKLVLLNISFKRCINKSIGYCKHMQCITINQRSAFQKTALS